MKKLQKKSQLDSNSVDGTSYKIGHSFVMREISSGKMKRRKIISSIERNSMDRVDAIGISAKKSEAVRVVRQKLENRFKG